MRDDLYLNLVSGAICAAIAVWPRMTAWLLSYGRQADNAGLVDAFRWMGTAGLFLAAVSLPLMHLFR